jgi:hypothetical protein
MPLTASLLTPRSLDVHAGVIEEARNRQRRERAIAAALTAVIVAATIVAVAWPSGGGLGHGGSRGTVGLTGRPLATSPHHADAAPVTARSEARAQLTALVTRYFMVTANHARPAS